MSRGKARLELAHRLPRVSLLTISFAIMGHTTAIISLPRHHPGLHPHRLWKRNLRQQPLQGWKFPGGSSA